MKKTPNNKQYNKNALNLYKSIPIFAAIFFLAIIITVTSFILDKIKEDKKNEIACNLDTVLHTTHQTIKMWQESYSERINRLASYEPIIQGAQKLLELEPTKEILIASDAQKELRTIFKDVFDKTGDRGFFIISPDYISLGSMRDTNIGTENLIATNKPELLDKVFNGYTVFVPTMESDVPLSESAKQNNVISPTMFIATPIKNSKGNIIAAMTIRIDPIKSFSRITQLGRLGKSGETYAIDKQCFLITESRFDDQLRQIGFIDENEAGMLNIKVTDPGGNMLKGFRPDNPQYMLKPTLMAQNVLQGKKGHNLDGYRDYRGVNVLGSWLWDDELEMGFTTEIDVDEAMLSYYYAKNLILTLLYSTIALVSTLCALFIWMRRNIQNNLEKSKKTLEEKVKQRTEELTQSNVQLKKAMTQRELYKLLFDFSKDAIITMSSDNRFLDCNKATLEIFGYKDKNQFRGLTPIELSPQYQPDGELSEEKAERVIAIAMEKGSNSFEWKHKKVDGTEFYASVLLTQVNNDNENMLLVTLRDITESKKRQISITQQQKTLKAVFDTAPVGMLLIDKNFVIKKINEVAANIVQRNPEEFCNKMLGDGFSCANSQKRGCGRGDNCPLCTLRGSIRKVFQTNQPINKLDVNSTYEVDGILMDKWLEVNIQPIELDNTENAIVIISDITQRKLEKEELEKTKSQAEAASIAKSQFLANMSHEIRTPLNGVTGMLDLAMDENINDKVRGYLHTCKLSADALLNIINDILDISKIEAGRMDVEKIDCSINQILLNIDSLMGCRAREKGIDFDFIFETPVPETIKTDPMRTRQCLLNLIGNAIKFTKKGYVQVHLSVTEDNGSTFLNLAVHDTGIGIEKNKNEQIFDKFSQADNTITRKFGGTGLGLSITKQLAELLGGTLTVESVVGQGSIFTLHLPIDPETMKGNLISELNREVLSLDGIEISKRYNGNVLVAEDTPINQEVIKNMLENIGLKVDIAENGKEAITAATELCYNLIFMDVHMPIMNGLDATRLLREAGLQTPIIMLTANVMQEDIDSAIKAGANEHLAKPIDRKKLYEMLDKYLTHHQVNHEPSIDDVTDQIQDLTQLITQTPDQTNTNTDIDCKDAQDIQINFSVIFGVFDDQMALKLFNIFIKDSQIRIQSIEQAIKEGNHQQLQESAHSLKGMSGQIGEEQLHSKSYALEKAAKDQQTESYKQLFAEVKKRHGELMDFFKQDNWFEKAKYLYKQTTNK